MFVPLPHTQIQMASSLLFQELVTVYWWQHSFQHEWFSSAQTLSTHVKHAIWKREIIFYPALEIIGKVSHMCEQKLTLQLMPTATFARWYCQTTNSNANNKQQLRWINIKRNYNAYVKQYCLFIEKLQTTEYNWLDTQLNCYRFALRIFPFLTFLEFLYTYVLQFIVKIKSIINSTHLLRYAILKLTVLKSAFGAHESHSISPILTPVTSIPEFKVVCILVHTVEQKTDSLSCRVTRHKQN